MLRCSPPKNASPLSTSTEGRGEEWPFVPCSGGLPANTGMAQAGHLPVHPSTPRSTTPGSPRLSFPLSPPRSAIPAPSTQQTGWLTLRGARCRDGRAVEREKRKESPGDTKHQREERRVHTTSAPPNQTNLQLREEGRWVSPKETRGRESK